MSQAATRSRHGKRDTTTASYLLRLTPEQSEELKKLAEEQSLTVRALLLHRALGVPLDDPSLDPTPGRKVPRPQEELPMTG